ncbi:MAG: family 20 glycosylhydrolase, partial [Loktanella sp.]|nr:family 20 glycosylhydrolase [Loktanella sp.]
MRYHPRLHFLNRRKPLLHLALKLVKSFDGLRFHLTDDEGWRIEIKSHPELAT